MVEKESAVKNETLLDLITCCSKKHDDLLLELELELELEVLPREPKEARS